MDRQFLLNDEQMRQFVTEGYLVLRTNLSDEFHERLQKQLNEVYSQEGNPGNNLLPRIPELQAVFDEPVVRGALTSVLGEGYLMHPHRHGHYNKSPKPGNWHKDSYWGHQKIRNHRPWWAMIFYFPQDVPIEMGPTGVMPGTQTYQTRTFQDDETAEERRSIGQAGTFAIVHYDIWHRATANTADKDRYMLKFQFLRTQIPTAPSWNNVEPEWVAPKQFTSPIYKHEVQWRDTWNWLTGRAAASALQQRGDAAASSAAPAAADSEAVAQLLEALRSGDEAARTSAADDLGLLGAAAADQAVPALAQALEDAFEPVALNAAYALAQMGAAGHAALAGALRHADAAVVRAAGYGASTAGAGIVPALAEALAADSANTAAAAAFALGELGAAGADAAPQLAALLGHAEAKVRRAAVEALGLLGGAGADVAEALARGLADGDDQVRFTAATAVTRLGASGDPAVPALEKALADDNRYVRATAADALYYVGTSRAKDALIRFLRTARWCPTTTASNTF